MSKQLNESIKSTIMATKAEYDSLHQAIRLAKLHNADDKNIRDMVLAKEELKSRRVSDDAKILKLMTLATNVINMQGSWYAIRYLNDKNDLAISLEILNSNDIHVLQRDCRSERELSRKELAALVPGCIDEVELEIHKQSSINKAHQYLHDYCGIVIEDTESPSEAEVERPVNVSAHVGMRWVQRKLGIGVNNETVAEDYRRTHLKEVEAGVLEGYSNAEVVWVAEDGIEFSFGEDNIMYVKGNQNGYNNLVTLYEEDFGFTKDINRMITFKQLEVLAQARQSLWDTEREQDELLKGTDDAIRDIVDKVALLQSQIELLHAEKATLMSVKDQHLKVMKVARNKYSSEFNKLFKKWNS